MEVTFVEFPSGAVVACIIAENSQRQLEDTVEIVNAVQKASQVL